MTALILEISEHDINSMSKCIDLDILFVRSIYYLEVEIDELLYSAHLLFTKLFIFHQWRQCLIIDEDFDRNVSQL